MTQMNIKQSSERSRRILLGVLACGALALSSGCVHVPQKPIDTKVKQAQNDDKDRKQFQEYERRHIAPPPAYGNKVVLAQDESPASTL